MAQCILKFIIIQLGYGLNSKSVHTIKNALNVQVDKFNVGYSLAHDTKSLTALEFVGGYTAGEKFFFLRGDHFKKLLTLGASYTAEINGKRIVHSQEVEYDANKKQPGIAGSHVTYRFGGEYPYDHGAQILSRLEFNDKLKFNLLLKQRVNENLIASFDVQQTAKDPLSNPLNLKSLWGLTLEYAL